LENTKANKLIDKILKNIDKTGINAEALVEDLKELRVYAVEQEQKVPLLVKVLRLTYEHIEAHETFLIPILNDEPLDEEDESLEATTATDTPEECLKYLIALAKNLDNKGNISDLREYKALLADY